MKSTERKKAVGNRATKEGTAQVPIVVGIGASAGGLEAFTNLLRHVPPDTGLGFVLVQHLDPEHDSALTQILTRATSMPVREVTNNLRVEANHVYVIPPNRLLSIAQGRLTLRPRQRTRIPLRSIDHFFESLAQDQRERAIGVILSGTASDGTLGLEAIKAEGGITIAQDESAKYDSMPRSAVSAGCVDFILSPEQIAKELARIAKHPYAAGQVPEPLTPARSPLEGERESETPGGETPLSSRGQGRLRSSLSSSDEERARVRSSGADNGYKKILLLLRNHTGVDFSLYKQTTTRRRITRRLILSKHNTLNDYADFLRANPKELNALYSDVLISVTSFFRNPDAFDVLTRTVFPKLLQQRGDDPLRVWVLGCSTGQEAYSIAMAFVETVEKAPRSRKVQVFATDLNDALLDNARHGLYAKSLVQDLSPERVRRFFVEEDGGYRVSKPLRETVVFARHNLITDPPFSRMDLISCRNLLIYLEPAVQKQAMPTFHYALKPGGFLFLGASESVGSFTNLFEPVDKKHKVYAKKAGATPAFHLPVKKERDERPSPRLRPSSPHPMGRGEGEGRRGKGLPDASEGVCGELNAQREADRVTVNQFAPPGVLINADLQILQFRGTTGAYLAPPRGKATFDVLKMAREGLMLPLRDAINRAKKGHATVRKDRVRVRQNGKTRTVNLKVIPLKNVRERCFLILFEEAVGIGAPRPRPLTARGLRPHASLNLRINELESDLAETRDYLQSVQEQHEASNEELQASNEEVQSANEELQSVNEELETSKEELESANEELTTVNEEMANRNAELGRLNGDLLNLQTSIKLAIILLGRDLTIRRFTPQAETLFNLLATDVGRPLSNVRHNLLLGEHSGQVVPPSIVSPRQTGKPAQAGWQVERPEGLASDVSDYPSDLEALVADVIASVRGREQEVRDTEGRWYLLRVRPYFTLDSKVDGAVLVLVDITDLKRNEQAIAAARQYAESTIETVRGPLLVLDGQLHVESVNRAFYRTFRVAPAETVGRFIYDLGNGQWDIPRLRSLLEEMLPQSTRIDDFLVEHTFEQLGRRSMLLNARIIDGHFGAPARILLAIEDISERKESEDARVMLAAIVESSDDAIMSKDLNGIIRTWNEGAERLFGYSAQEVIGRHVSILIPTEREEEEPHILACVARGEVVNHYETVRRSKDGRLIDISLTVSPTKDAQGQIIGASSIARDITKRKRIERNLRESEERFRLLADSAPALIWVNDLKGCVFVSRGYLEFLGADITDVRGYDWAQFVHPEDREQYVNAYLQAMSHQDRFEAEFRFRRRDGEYRWMHSVGHPRSGSDGTFLGYAGLTFDITERREAEEALRESQDKLRAFAGQLEELVQARTQELVSSQERLRALAAELNLTEQRERQRLASELHDYLAQLLAVSKIKLAQAKQQGVTPSVGQALTEVQQVMDQALTYTRTLMAQLSPPIQNEFGLPMALKWLAEQMKHRDFAVSLELEGNSLPLPEDQARLLYQSARELIINVMKHGQTDHATVGVTVAKGVLRLVVTDQGAGFDLAAAAAKTDHVPHFGLFSIRERMKALGGDFELRSRPGEGTQATLVLPLTPKTPQAANHELGMKSEELGMKSEELGMKSDNSTFHISHSSWHQSGKIRVLLVDDHAMVRQGLKSILEAYQDISVVGEAADGEEAVELARVLSPDVVVMDVNMPKMDGIEAVRRIKAQQPATLIVGLSLSQAGQVEPRLLQAGASHFVSKDLAADRLYEAIIAVVRHVSGSAES